MEGENHVICRLVPARPPICNMQKADQKRGDYESINEGVNRGSSGGIRPKSGGGVTRNGTSHSGAGRAIGGGNTKSSLPRQLVSLAAGFIPVVGDVKDAQEVLTGKDLITKEKLSAGERLLTAAGALIPVVSGKAIRAAGKAGGELAGEVMKHGLFPLSRCYS